MGWKVGGCAVSVSLWTQNYPLYTVYCLYTEAKGLLIGLRFQVEYGVLKIYSIPGMFLVCGVT